LHCFFMFPLFRACSLHRYNQLGVDGAVGLTQALHHLPQLRTLNLSCALAFAQRRLAVGT
jgi:glycyl-tRNA synthetase alpha subunit